MFAHSKRAWAMRVWMLTVTAGSLWFFHDRATATTTAPAIEDAARLSPVAQPLGPHVPQDIGSEWQPFVPGVVGYVSAIARSGTGLCYQDFLPITQR